MNAKRYRVSSDYYNRHNEWWYDTEDAAREKRAVARHAGREVERVA